MVNDNNTHKLREMVMTGRHVIAPGVYDCLSARVAEQSGFGAVMISGAGVAASMLGVPDLGLMSFEESVSAARRIAASTSVPVIADCDDGFGSSLNVYRTVQEFERAGVAGLFIEDQKFPKKCGHFAGKSLIGIDEMSEKIRAAVDARRDPDLMLIARTDARAVEGQGAALERARAYVASGADGIFVEAPLSRQELVDNVAALYVLAVPMMANMAEGGRTPLLTGDELAAIGYSIITFPGAFQKTALWAMQELGASLSRTSGVHEFYPEKMMGLAQRSELLGLDTYLDRAGRYANSNQLQIK